MKIINLFWSFLETLTLAKAAGVLARQGRKHEAIELMNKKFI